MTPDDIICTLTVRKLDDDPLVVWVKYSPCPLITSEDQPFPKEMEPGWLIDVLGNGGISCRPPRVN